MDIKPWPTLRSKPLGDFRIFAIRSDVKASPLTGREHDFFVIEAVDWVNIIPITKNGQIVMVEQYRHGSNTVELEVPGGVMDRTDPDPVATGLRELREETGYEGEGARIIGKIRPNPAIMNNFCHTVLVEQCELRHAHQFDATEDLRTTLIEPAEIPDLIRVGRISHSLVVAAFHHLHLFQMQAQK